MKKLFLYLLLTGFVLSNGAFAQLDGTFGSGGTAFINNVSSTAITRDMAIQADNKVILVAPCFNINISGVPFCAVRLNENGSTDTTFRGGSAGNGVFTWFDAGHTGGVAGVVVQTDGKVVAAGAGPGFDVALVRYNTDGSLDSSFGTAGVVLTNLTPGSNDQAEKVAMQPDGKIVIVGTTGSAQFVARYLPNGTLDTSFGTGGIAKTILAKDSTEGRSLAIQTDGKIVAGGLAVSGSYLLTRFNSDGSPDSTWDGDGVKTIPIDPAGASNPSWKGIGIRSVAIQPDGRVVAIGHKNILFSFNPDGSLDTSFDGDGSRQALVGTDKETYSLTVSPAGTITVVGATLILGNNVPYRYLVARYNPDGSPDTTFSDDGYLDISVPGFNSLATAVAADPIGRIVVAGVSGSGIPLAPLGSPVFSAARLLGPPVPVSLTGRVTTFSGTPLGGATVKTIVNGVTVTTRTSAFGYYIFSGVLTGQTYTLDVSAKRQRFTPQNITITNQFANLDFVAQEGFPE